MLEPVTNTKISDVTTANDDVPTAQTFQYNLNVGRTRKHLYEGALRKHFEREDKKTCINLSFSDGAFTEVVLKAVEDLKTGPRHFIVGKEEVERTQIDSRKELSSKFVGSKVDFKVNNDEKVTIHVYNTRQKLTIQGKRFKWFVDNYLETFLKIRISKSMEDIEAINKRILTELSPDINSRVKEKTSLDEEVETVNCDICKFSTSSPDNLRKHIVDEHTVNLFKGLSFQKLKQIELTEKNKVPTKSLSSQESDNINIDDEMNEDNDEILLQGDEDVKNCGKCEETFTIQEDYDKHIELHLYADKLSLAFHICRVCNKTVKSNELSIQCSKCIHYFHKKCTSKKESRGNWKSSSWTCQICGPGPDSHSLQTLDPNATTFSVSVEPPSGERIKLPTLSGRQKKSNIKIDNPETEFLKSQVDNLKGIVSQNDQEIKKLKESNDLKAKRINQLELQIREALKLNVENKEEPNHATQINDTDTATRISSLEQKFSFLLDQISIINSKEKSAPKKATDIFSYLKCDNESNSKEDNKSHTNISHRKQHSCDDCQPEKPHRNDASSHKP